MARSDFNALPDSYFLKDSETLTAEAIKEAQEGWWAESMKTLDERLAWWREVRLGCFVHWGAYTALNGVWRGKIHGGYGEHIQRVSKIFQADYKKHAVEQFNPTGFDADEWIRMISDAGLKYFVITAKHHDGFAMWDSKVSDYNIVAATPFKRDPMRELKEACDRYGVKFGLYYSHAFDWGEEFGLGNDWEYENPGGNKHLKGGHNWWDECPELRRTVIEKYVNGKAIPQILELIHNYDPDILWFDTPHKLPHHENSGLSGRSAWRQQHAIALRSSLWPATPMAVASTRWTSARRPSPGRCQKMCRSVKQRSRSWERWNCPRALLRFDYRQTGLVKVS